MKARSPFNFYTSSQLVEITGRKASNLNELASILKEIDESSIFYHVHHAFREYQFAPGVYMNDFAYWAASELSLNALAESLANINIKDYTEIKALRENIVGMIEEFTARNPEKGNAAANHKFYFCKNIGVVQKTKYSAWDLEEFCRTLNYVGLRSLFFHFFESRLRLGRKTNDFSDWIKVNFGDQNLAKRIEALDPYLYTMDELKAKMIGLICEKKGGFFMKVLRWLRVK